MDNLLKKINEEWAPIKWTEGAISTDSIRTFVAIYDDVIISCQYSIPEYGLYAFKIEGTEENIKNFIHKRG